MTDGFFFEGFNFFEAAPGQVPESDLPREVPGAGRVEGEQFFSDLAGRSVLVFRQSSPNDPASFPATGDAARESAVVRVVETRHANAPMAWNSNRPMIYTAPRQNHSVEFDGSDDYFAVPLLEDSLASSQSLSVEAWLEPSSGGAQYFFAINTGTGGNRALMGYDSGEFNLWDSGKRMITTFASEHAYTRRFRFR